ncbi:unnamed protein product [Caenorhabditis sp. 36 PRJEB53466]|nr:unnamed protein product [Caenorhabditis sp. 36 PRJEB53466]
MKRYLLLFSLPCVLIIPMIVYQTSVFRNSTSETNEYYGGAFVKRSTGSYGMSCQSLLLHLNTTVPILIIDPVILEQLEKGSCVATSKKPVKIGVDVKHLSENALLEDARFEVMYFTNDAFKDYLDFRTEPRRIIPKKFSTHFVANVEVPANISMFLGFWKRSKFVDCMNLFIPRAGAKVNISPRPSSASLALLRDELLEHGMFPFLNGGTLLGWFRECSVIPHTSDMDLAVFAEDYRPGFVAAVERNESVFKLKRKLGMMNDSFELTVEPKRGYHVHIDIFVMYEGKENGTDHRWVGGVGGDGTKYKFIYPAYDPWCSADLHGHIFWVTCSPKAMLEKEYGQLWYRDHLTSKYAWNASGKNVKLNGKWTKEQMKRVYNVY